jgi:hypothetical protein
VDKLNIETTAPFGAKTYKPPFQFKVKKQINLVHGRRAGSHGIIGWIMTGHKPPRIWANNVKMTLSHNRKINLIESPTGTNNVAVVNFEDPFPTRGYREYMELVHQHKYDPKCGNVTTLLIIRDIYNYLASRMKSDSPGAMIKDNAHLRKVIQDWMMQAEYCVGEIQNKSDSGEVNFISYNEWFGGDYDGYGYVEYWEQQLKFDKPGDTQIVSSLGKGSSFDGTKVPADKMNVLERYKQIELPSGVLKSQELADLNKTLFGWSLL